MKRFIFLLVLWLSAFQVFAFDCDSDSSGNWDEITWSNCGGGIPGDGDQAEILTGHNVTIDTNLTIGTDGAANTYAIATNAGSTLTIASGVTVTMKGELYIYDGTVTMNGTAHLDFLVTNNQRIYLGDNYQGSAKFIINGTSKSARATLSNNASSTGVVNVFCRINNEHPEYIDWEFVQVDDFGSSSANAFDCTANYTGDRISLIDVVWDGCGRVFNTYDPQPNFDFIVQRNKFVNCANSSNVCYRSTFNTDKGAGTGTWLFDNNVVEGIARFYEGRDLTITNNLFYGDVQTTYTSGDSWAAFTGNLVRSTTGAGNAFPGDTTNNYFFMNNSSQTNPHYFQTVLSTATTHDGNVIEFDGANDEGDGYLIHAPGSATTITLQNNLFLCGTSTNGIGTLFSALGGSNATIVANHNTWCVGSQGAAVGETYAGHSGMVSSFRSNIGWNQAASAGYLMFDSGADDTVSDLVTSANLDYNVAYNLTGVENNLEFSSGTPNSNGWTSDPNFVDDTRDLGTWDSSLGGAGTAANALTELLKRNDSDWDSNYNIAALVTYVKAGFAVQNSDLENAGHDSATVGCCGYQAAATPAPVSGEPSGRSRRGYGS